MDIIPAELIRKKRNGGQHTENEIRFLVRSYVSGELPDYQMAAWLMSVFFKGMTPEEMHFLTQEMMNSGKVMDFSYLSEPKIDKHSTGGVGDKTSLVLAPIAAAAGLKIPMIAGRGLGHTGGTLDKLEAIPGFHCRLSDDDFQKAIETIGYAFMGQTENICPADKKIYALRDVTGTVESIPLICASIMSKKLAEGLNGLVLDVKFGAGAFMKTKDDAFSLAEALVKTGRQGGKKVHAILTSMEEPLGRFAGNSLEVEESVKILKNEKLDRFEQDTKDLSVLLAAHMLVLGDVEKDVETAKTRVLNILESGKAFEKFEQVVKFQGGDLDKLPKSKDPLLVTAKSAGTLTAYDVESIGYSGITLGAGRRISTDIIEPTAGVEFHKKIGDSVEKGETIFTVFAKDPAKRAAGAARLASAFTISEKPCEAVRKVWKTIL